MSQDLKIDSVLGAQIRAMADRIVAETKPDRVILFGSHARGAAGPDSDIDLLVIQQTTQSRPKRSGPLYSLLRDFPYSKDIVVYTPEEIDAYRGLPQSFIMTALREGVVLYEKR